MSESTELREKVAAVSSLVSKVSTVGGFGKALGRVAETVGNISTIAAAASVSGLALKRVADKISNDTRRKALIDDLIRTDPVIQKVDKAQVMEWYATIYNVAPTLSADKSAVREVLQNFARFGRADMQTLKMLAETEKTMAGQHVSNSWAGILTGAVR